MPRVRAAQRLQRRVLRQPGVPQGSRRVLLRARRGPARHVPHREARAAGGRAERPAARPHVPSRLVRAMGARQLRSRRRVHGLRRLSLRPPRHRPHGRGHPDHALPPGEQQSTDRARREARRARLRGERAHLAGRQPPGRSPGRGRDPSPAPGGIPTMTAPALPPGPGLGARAARFFFMHLGTLVAIVVYFQVFERGGYTRDALRTALWIGLLVKTGYVALAYRMGEHKYFDVAVWVLFAIGVLASRTNLEPVLALYQMYSPALVFLAFALCAGGPLLLGREPFTLYYARRSIPRWQMVLPEATAVSRVMAAYWTVIFLAAATLCAHAPTDPRFTLIYPNLLVFIVGIPAQFWLPPLYFRLFPPGLPRAIEPLLMSMPFAFNRRAAGDARARIQFDVSGPDAGAWWLRIADGRCESFEGRTPDADLVVTTPDRVWIRIAHGELDGGQALAQGLYRVDGDTTILAHLPDWFSARR